MPPDIIRESDQVAVAEQIRQALERWSEARVGPRNTERFTLSIRDDDGRLLGGLVGELLWNALYVAYLWVNDSHQRRGFGTNLLIRAEEIARASGREIAFLMTNTFEAPAFYEKCGYTQFAELDAAPKGFSRLWFTKRL